MQKTGTELVKERMKARAFIKSYYTENGELPTAQQVAAARQLTEGEIAEVVEMEQRAALIAESEDREHSALSFSAAAPKVGMNMPILGRVAIIEVTDPNQVV